MKKDAVILGDYNSARSIQLVITFEVCKDEPDTPVEKRKCRPEKEIYDWMSRKFIGILENQISFSRELIEDNILTKSSGLRWFVLSPQIRLDNYNYVEI